MQPVHICLAGNQMMDGQTNILIVGAGPTGLTAAIELARRGYGVRIIEKRETGSGLSRAVGILPESIRVLRPSGVSDRLLEEGVKLADAKFYFGGHQVFRLELDSDKDNLAFILALAQDRTESIMRDCLARLGISVEFGTELAGFSQNEDKVVARLADGSETQFDYLVGADGVSSTTRKAAGIEFPGFDLPETWSIADVNASNWPHKGSFVVCRLNGGRIAVAVQLEEDRYRVISNTPDALETFPLDLNVTLIRRQGTFRISIRQVAEYNIGRVFLAGDAAHCHSPAGGRGMNLGISDAVELAQRFEEGTLDGYSQSRHDYGKSVIALSERGRKFVTSKSVLVNPMLRLIFAILGSSRTIRRRATSTILNG